MIIDHLSQLIQLKICYFGPAFSGKTTSIKALFENFVMKKRVISIESSIGRTLFFDYGTIIFENKKWMLKIHIYSTTGQDFYIITRPTTLMALDGIIFVIDSLETAYYRNLTSWYELCSYFEDKLIYMPKVFAFNKQDLSDLFDPAYFLDNINYFKLDNLLINNTIATEGEGILKSFEDLLSLIFNNSIKTPLTTIA
ncbi:MAG: ATP/GTP-binding protein, partial [Candidatus Thorarchaeota archaeon]